MAKRSKVSSKIPILVRAKLLILCAFMCVFWGLNKGCTHAKYMIYMLSTCSPLILMLCAPFISPLNTRCRCPTKHRLPCLDPTDLLANTFSFIPKNIFILIRFTFERLPPRDLTDTAQENGSDNLISPSDCSVVQQGLSPLPGNHSLED